MRTPNWEKRGGPGPVGSNLGKVRPRFQPGKGATGHFETWVLVPESNGNGGPAAVFWFNVLSVNDKPIRSVLGRAAVNPADLRVSGGWQRNEVCLFPEWSGRWFRLQLRLGDIPPLGDSPVDPPIRIYVDDFELTTSLACRSDRAPRSGQTGEGRPHHGGGHCPSPGRQMPDKQLPPSSQRVPLGKFGWVHWLD